MKRGFARSCNIEECLVSSRSYVWTSGKHGYHEERNTRSRDGQNRCVATLNLKCAIGLKEETSSPWLFAQTSLEQ